MTLLPRIRVHDAHRTTAHVTADNCRQAPLVPCHTGCSPSAQQNHKLIYTDLFKFAAIPRAAVLYGDTAMGEEYRPMLFRFICRDTHQAQIPNFTVRYSPHPAWNYTCVLPLVSAVLTPTGGWLNTACHGQFTVSKKSKFT
jgi:hypothetical protein